MRRPFRKTARDIGLKDIESHHHTSMPQAACTHHDHANYPHQTYGTTSNALRSAVDRNVETSGTEVKDQADDRLAVGNAGTMTASEACVEVKMVSQNVCSGTPVELHMQPWES